jgi:large subunit ribosomal protein L10
MHRTEKESFVHALRERINRAPVLYLTDFTGLDVKAMSQLRRSLKDSGAEYLVVKNRLAMRAFAETDEFPDISGSLEGPTGLVFGYEDVVSPAKTLSDFAKEHNDRPVFKLGVMDRQVLQPAQIDKLAKLPGREQLLAELAGAMEAPMAQLAAAMEAKVQEMAGLLEALKAEREQA